MWKSPTMTRPRAPEPSYSIRLVQPFLAVLRHRSEISQEILQALGRLDPDQRIPVGRALELLERATVLTGDPELGLRAAREATQGDYDLLEYAASSCETAAEAVEVIGRYFRLVNDVAELSLETHDLRGSEEAAKGHRLRR